MGNSVEYSSCNCVLFSYSQGRTGSGGIASPVLSKGKQRARSKLFITVLYHREFHGKQDLVETNLLQLFTHPQHSK